MNYPVTTIYADVRVALDQNQSESQLVAIDYTLEFDDLVAQKLLHAARQILETAPAVMIDNGKDMRKQEFARGDVEIGDGLYYYTLKLPTDYLRLLSLKLSSWDTTLRSTVEDGSEAAQMARSEFLGITGNPSRPIAIDDYPSKAERRLIIYSGDKNETLDRAVYCQEPAIVNGMLNFPVGLYNTLVYRTAALVTGTYGNTTQMQTLLAMSGQTPANNNEGGEK